MSEFKVEVVEVGEIAKHPDADSLSVARVRDYPVVIRTGDFKPGDRAVYVPVDSVVPTVTGPFAFLHQPERDSERIKAKKLRGVFSMGLLVKADPAWPVGLDVRAMLGVTKYEPPEPATMGGEDERDPGFLPVYTDVEGLRRWPNVLREGEPVVLTEKIHGANGRFLFHEGRLWVGSHTRIKRESATNLWWQVARRHELASRLEYLDGLVFYGEVYGQVQDLKYGAAKGELKLAIFDVFSLKRGCYLDWVEMQDACSAADLETVPVLYEGPWSDALRSHAEGMSTLDGANHVREGFVVKPTRERRDDRVGRVILKLHGEGYLTRKGG